MSKYTTPGVYTKEVTNIAPSVAEVATAIPAFIGKTTKQTTGLKRISSFREFIDHFGGPTIDLQIPVPVVAGSDGKPNSIPSNIAYTQPKDLLPYCMEMYFANGGGPCWVHGVDENTLTKFKGALEAIANLSEPTLLVIPDAVTLEDDARKDLYDTMHEQCETLQDRFCIFDAKSSESVKDALNLRRSLPREAKYAAAYYPQLHCFISRYSELSENYEVDDSGTTYCWRPVYRIDKSVQLRRMTKGDAGALGNYQSDRAEVLRRLALPSPVNDDFQFVAKLLDNIMNLYNHYFYVGSHPLIAGDFEELKKKDPNSETWKNQAKILASHIENFRGIDSAMSQGVWKWVQSQRALLPPSAAIAGVFARVDGQSGVWRAPGNVPLFGVVGLEESVSNERHGELNVDPVDGKSINVIRSTSGGDVLVMGARTLHGNSNEWRFVSTRRFFNLVEESVANAVSASVFAPNDANTWATVQSTIENFLTQKWREGALFGASPADAFSVSIGLGRTMSQEDILNGIMKVNVQMRVVTPAEVIVLTYFHKRIK